MIEVLEKLMLKGMNVARLNFSHGDHEEQKKRVDTFEMIREKLGLPISLLLDTKGPEIRIGKFETGEAVLNQGDSFVLMNKEIMGDNTRVSVTYKDLYKDVKRGSRILIEIPVEEVPIVQKMLINKCNNNFPKGSTSVIQVVGSDSLSC